MCPATSAILGNMLVKTVGQVGFPIHVRPSEAVWQILRVQIGVRQGTLDRVMNSILADLIKIEKE